MWTRVDQEMPPVGRRVMARILNKNGRIDDDIAYYQDGKWYRHFEGTEISFDASGETVTHWQNVSGGLWENI